MKNDFKYLLNFSVEKCQKNQIYLYVTDILLEWKMLTNMIQTNWKTHVMIYVIVLQVGRCKIWAPDHDTKLMDCERFCFHPKQDEALWFIFIKLQYIPRNMHMVFALLCFVVVIHWLIFPYPSGLLHWHCGNLTIAPVPAKQPWWIWINTSCEFIMNDCITTTKQRTTKPCAYFLGYTVHRLASWNV